MGFVLKLIDAILFLFFLLIAVVAPLFDAQTILPPSYFPEFLVELKDWYTRCYIIRHDLFPEGIGKAIDNVLPFLGSGCSSYSERLAVTFPEDFFISWQETCVREEKTRLKL